MSKIEKKIETALAGRRKANYRSEIPERINVFTNSFTELKISDENILGYSRGDNDFGYAIGCDSKNMDREREVVFSKALFNQKWLDLEKQLAVLISYETILTRNPIQRLDLIALQPGVLWAIECKLNLGGNTELEYALLESLAYGLLLSRHISDRGKSVREQLIKALDHHVNIRKNSPLFNYFMPVNRKLNVKYVVAGPVSYFREYIRKSGDKAAYRVKRTIDLENALISLNTADMQFGGYLVFADGPENMIAKKNGNAMKPYMSKLVGSVEKLQQQIGI